jgi:hypothetical protein
VSQRSTQDAGGTGCAGCLIVIGLGIFVVAIGIAIIMAIPAA